MTRNKLALLTVLPFVACTNLPPPAQPPVPNTIMAPGETAVLTLRGTGAQIYQCAADPNGKLAWAFREPVATLTAEGITVGRHYTGPTWELTDGSTVTGKATANAPGATPNDIPWLKLAVATHRGSGKLSSVTTIQRVRTEGGAASGACDSAGSLLSVPYAADYVFLRKRS